MRACSRFAASALLAPCLAPAAWAVAAGLLLASGLAPAARAGDELHLRWDNCFGDGGTHNRVFACDVNTGTNVLVGSFRFDATTTEVTGLTATLHLSAVDPTVMPPWWDLRVGGCRQGSLQWSLVPPPTSTGCADPWTPNGAIGGFSYQVFNPYEWRLLIQHALPAPTRFDVPGGQENVAFVLRVNNARTVGATSCSGCSVPLCIGWGRTLITRAPGLGNVTLFGADTPENGSNVTWQPGGVATTWKSCGSLLCETGVTCQSVTPTRGSTWGSIKSLYR